MSQLKDAQAETVRMMARKQTHQTVYGLRAMRVDGTFAEINLDTLNDDDFGREAGTVAEPTLNDLMTKNNSTNHAAPSAPEMDRSSSSSNHAGAKTVEMSGLSGVSKRDDDVDRSIPMKEEGAKVVDENMTDQDKMTDVMLTKLNKQFNPFGIEICDLQIQDVRLPEEVQKTVESKTTIGTTRALEAISQR
jgi:hypothetical protein